MRRWLDFLAEIQSRGEPAISIVITTTKGSVPRETGTRMIVTTSEVFGTIGGGHLEFKAIEIAQDMLATCAPVQLKRFPLGASLGQCCGGLVNLLFEPVAPNATWIDSLQQLERSRTPCVVVTPLRGDATAGKLVVSRDAISGTLGAVTLDASAIAIATQRLATRQPAATLRVAGDEFFFEAQRAPDFNIVLFGAGHVGRALVKILSELPSTVEWIDSRDGEFPDADFAGVKKRVSEFPEDEVANAPTGSYFLVMTHSHALDQLITERILLRGDFAYFGLIGSVSKRRQFERKLVARGVPSSRIAEMACPIGARGIDSKEPMAIAVSIAMELMRHRSEIQQRSHSDNVSRHDSVSGGGKLAASR